jgi:Flp pilus assembly protein TadD
MLKIRPIVALILGISLVQGCAAPTTRTPMAIEPVMKVSHSMEQSAATYYSLGKYYQERGDLDLAAAAYMQALALFKSHFESKNALATVLSQQGKLKEAEGILRALIAERPDAARLYNNLGYVNYLQGNHVAATAELRTALALDPNSERARNNLQMAESALAERRTPAISMKQQASTEAQAVPESKISQETESRTQWVQVLPNVYELKRKTLVEPAASESVASVALPPSSIPATTPIIEAKTFRFEISNGNGVLGIAKRVGHALLNKGFVVNRLTNERPFQRQVTEIQYRDGFVAEAAALREALSGQAEMVAVKQSNGSDIRLVLGKDGSANKLLVDSSCAKGEVCRIPVAARMAKL